jgi:hypothetical protein
VAFREKQERKRFKNGIKLTKHAGILPAHIDGLQFMSRRSAEKMSSLFPKKDYLN